MHHVWIKQQKSPTKNKWSAQLTLFFSMTRYIIHKFEPMIKILLARGVSKTKRSFWSNEQCEMALFSNICPKLYFKKFWINFIKKNLVSMSYWMRRRISLRGCVRPSVHPSDCLFNQQAMIFSRSKTFPLPLNSSKRTRGISFSSIHIFSPSPNIVHE